MPITEEANSVMTTVTTFMKQKSKETTGLSFVWRLFEIVPVLLYD